MFNCACNSSELVIKYDFNSSFVHILLSVDNSIFWPCSGKRPVAIPRIHFDSTSDLVLSDAGTINSFKDEGTCDQMHLCTTRQSLKIILSSIYSQCAFINKLEMDDRLNFDFPNNNQTALFCSVSSRSIPWY